MSKKRESENINHLLKTKTEAFTFLTKENIVVKHEKEIKISFIDLTPYINEEFGFIDPDFPHVHASINENENSPNQTIEWVPAEQIHEITNYSDHITNLQSNLFHKKSISYALIIINWFQNTIFKDIFLNQLSSYHLYSYDVMIDGVFMHMPIDSYVPINSSTKTQIFTKNFKGSVFPCLYEKLLAKIYGDYESITTEFMDIVELQTMYCRQEVNLVGKVKESDIIAIIKEKLGEKSIVSFRTRNSIRLESFGLQSNYVYIILRLIQKEKETIVEFLQLDGQSWIGKHSKLRSDWLLEQDLIQQKQIIRNQEYKQNYMSISDMKGIGRELVILNNTLDFHKNYFVSQNNQSYFQMYRLSLQKSNKCMLRVNFKHKKCYNAIYLIQKVQGEKYKLIKTVFNENKQSNYLQYDMKAGEYFVIIYNSHPQEEILPYNLTLFTSSQFVEIQPLSNPNDTLQILQSAFLNYFTEVYETSKEIVLFRQLYSSTGLAFIFIKSPPNSISVTINNKIFQERKIFCVNLNPTENEFTATFPPAHYNLIIFRCLWSKKQNIDFEQDKVSSSQQVQKIVFPPFGSVKITQKIKK